MLKDYLKYLNRVHSIISIYIKAPSSMDYSDVFNYTYMAEQLFWFNDELAKSDSLVREKNISLKNEEKTKKLNNLFKTGYTSSENMVKLYQPKSNGTNGVDIDDVPLVLDFKEKTPSNLSMGRRTEVSLKEEVQGVISHGIYIDEWRPTEKEIYMEKSIHGLFIDEWTPQKVVVHAEKREIHGIFLDEWSTPSRERYSQVDDIHGVFLDEWEAPKDEVSGVTDTYEKSSIDIYSEDEEVYSITSDVVDTQLTKPESNIVVEKDLSDKLQDITNSVLTSGKRFIIGKLSNPKL